MNLCGYTVGLREPFFLIAGNCVVESEATTMQTAETLATICQRLDVPLIYKSSFDKANRSSVQSYRGPGIEVGLKLLARVREQFGLPVVTDRLAGISDETLLAIMARDKKTLNGQLRFVLPDRIGQVALVDGVRPAAAATAIASVRCG